jgi:hypothetical protein
MYNLYSFTNYYGNKMFAIASGNAMPAKYDKILFTGNIEECHKRYVKELAYFIMNETNAAKWEPVYQTAYNILYKGNATKEQERKISKLQYDDMNKMSYCPMDLLLKIRSLITTNKRYYPVS